MIKYNWKLDNLNKSPLEILNKDRFVLVQDQVQGGKCNHCGQNLPPCPWGEHLRPAHPPGGGGCPPLQTIMSSASPAPSLRRPDNCRARDSLIGHVPGHIIWSL